MQRKVKCTKNIQSHYNPKINNVMRPVFINNSKPEKNARENENIIVETRITGEERKSPPNISDIASD